MTWIIATEEPLQSAPSRNRDESGWVWEIQREGEVRGIAVTITGQAWDSSREDIRAARETRGRSAVLGVIDRDDPPRWITLTTGGREEEPYGDAA